MAEPIICANPAPHVGRAPADHGVGRTCVECGCRVGRYTTPQPITGDALCNRHWHVPEGYLLAGNTLRVRKDHR